MRMRIGEQILQARERAGMTQTELGELVDMDAPAISRLEKQRRPYGATTETLNVIARALGATFTLPEDTDGQEE